MSIKQAIEKDFLEAYKKRDEQTVSVLRMIKSAIKNAEINTKAEFSDDETIKLLRKEAKQREMAAAEYEKGGRIDLSKKERAEAKLITEYLPAEMDEATLLKVVQEAIREVGATELRDMGRIMPLVMKKVGSNADGGNISRIVRELLQK